MYKASISQRYQSINDELLWAYLNHSNCAHLMGRVCFTSVKAAGTKCVGARQKGWGEACRRELNKWRVGNVQECLLMMMTIMIIIIIITNNSKGKRTCLRIRLTNCSRAGVIVSRE